MKIIIIGSGNAAAVIGRKCRRAGHQIIQVVSRNSPAASELAYEWETESTNYLSLINKSGDVYIIAVSDNAITEVVRDMHLPGKVVAHTAGSVPKEILKTVTDNYGVFYPLQSLRKEMDNLPDLPLFIDAATPRAWHVLGELARSVSPEKVNHVSNDDRLKLHVAAVVVNNFTNYLYMLAEDYCLKENIDFRLLLPLIEETATRLKSVSPSSVQTGPAIRDDRETIQKHLDLLASHTDLQKVYAFLSECIAERGQRL